ncbi:DUF4139 domain-containing protein [Bartonella sp. HY038]|uniref:DUF4139 domain-containing protein n=1 Tax=Bartonella sp. HY038 TaxID=2759660 RepID=UPI0015FB0E90|nr:DUF4139 domain-containing protein [Bartonella sp. HY038]
MKQSKILLASCASLLVASITQSSAQTVDQQIISAQSSKEIAITLYKDSLALVHEQRDVNLSEGINSIAFRNVSRMIRPETAFLSSAQTQLQMLQQSFHFDQLTPANLTAKYVGQQVTIVSRDKNGEERSEKATILSNDSGLILQYADRITAGLPADVRVDFGSLPQNLYDQPTLLAKVMSSEEGKKTVDLSYLSKGFDWGAEYAVKLNASEDKMLFTGWVTIKNNTDISYQNAKLTIIAGKADVFGSYEKKGKTRIDIEEPGITLADQSFEDRAAFNYNSYTISQPVTLNHEVDTQAALVNGVEVPVVKHYILDGEGSNSNDYSYSKSSSFGEQKATIGVYFDFANDKQSNLGMPLPSGNIRSFALDKNGSPVFLSQNIIDHVDPNAKVRLKFGNALDISAQMKSTESKKFGLSIKSGSTSETTNEITFKNTKDEAVIVEVPRRFYGEWEVLEENIAHEKRDDKHVVWKVKVDPKSEATLTYTVRVSE